MPSLDDSGLLVSVVLGSYQRRAFIEHTLNSVRQELAGLAHEIIVIDGGSSDGSVEWLSRQKDVLLVVQHNRGLWRGKKITRKSWGYFMNLGFRSAQGKYICMISDDCLVVPGAIRKGIAAFEAQLLSGRRLGALAFYWRNWPEQQEYVVGLTWGNKMFVNHGLYLNQALSDIGYAPETEYSFYHADGDMCLRLQNAGYDCADAKDSFIEHYSHANMQVRQSNNVSQSMDWKAYKDTWEHLGAPETDWISQVYVDELNTARIFEKIPEVRRKLRKSRWNSLRSEIRSFLGPCRRFFG